jgi:hypothetical protein
MGAPHRSQHRTSYKARWHRIFGTKQRSGHEESYLGLGGREEEVPSARGDSTASPDWDIGGGSLRRSLVSQLQS